MRHERHEGREPVTQDHARGFTDIAVNLLESHAAPGVNSLRYLDREQGVIVSVEVGQRPSSNLARLLPRGRLRQAQVRRNYFKKGVSVQILETESPADGAITADGEDGITGVLISWGLSKASRDIDKVQASPVIREVKKFPDFPHEAPVQGAPNLTDDEVANSTRFLKKLNQRDLIKDYGSFRTIAEVLEDSIIASEFVDWMEDTYRSRSNSIVFDGDAEKDKQANRVGVLEWFDQEGQMATLTFVPTHFKDYCIVVRQVQLKDKWLVTEYMVDRREKLPRIYKSELTRSRVQKITDQGIVDSPPFTYLETSPAPLVARENSIERDRIWEEVMHRTNRVEREEFDDLIYLACEVAIGGTIS